MKDARSLVVCVAILCLAAYLRFVSVAGTDFGQHGKVLSAYFYSQTRSLVFLVQFVGVLYLLFTLRRVEPPPAKAIAVASLLFTLVSLARFYLPIFLVSVIGDLLVLSFVRRNFFSSANAGNAEPNS